MSKLRILLAIAVVGASILAISTYQSQPNDPAPSKTVDVVVESKESLKTDVEPSEPKKAVEPEKVDVVVENPQDCDHATQWIWEDGSCHDKDVQPAEPKREVSRTSYSTDCESYRPLLEKYDWNVATMMRIMKAESGCNPTNHNWADNHRTCRGSFGLLQIGCIHGWSSDHLSNPANNIAAGYQVWRSGGYSSWTTW